MALPKKLLAAVDKLNSDKEGYGKNHINQVDKLEDVEIERVSTGLLELDIALGGKSADNVGVIRAGMVEIWGPESAGKTTLIKQLIKAFQIAKNNAIAFIDHEHTFDWFYAEQCGVMKEDVLFSQPLNGEQGINTAKKLINTGELDMLTFDSVAAMRPKKELEGEVEDTKMSKHANMMGLGVTQINNIAYTNNTLVIWINQLREKIGVMFGSPEKTTGGNALKFYCKQRLDIRKTEFIPKENPEWSRHRVTVKKNKAGVPFRKAMLVMELGRGFSPEASIVGLAIEAGVIVKNGGWFTVGKAGKVQGETQVYRFLQDNPEYFQALDGALRSAIFDDDDKELLKLMPEPEKKDKKTK